MCLYGCGLFVGGGEPGEPAGGANPAKQTCGRGEPGEPEPAGKGAASYGSLLWFWVWVMGLGYGFGCGLWFRGMCETVRAPWLQRPRPPQGRGSLQGRGPRQGGVQGQSPG
jgi:hypothetical protein